MDDKWVTVDLIVTTDDSFAPDHVWWLKSYQSLHHIKQEQVLVWICCIYDVIFYISTVTLCEVHMFELQSTVHLLSQQLCNITSKKFFFCFFYILPYFHFLLLFNFPSIQSHNKYYLAQSCDTSIWNSTTYPTHNTICWKGESEFKCRGQCLQRSLNKE